MEKQKKVLDASVIVKEFSNEIDTDKTIRLIKSHINNEISIIVPELLFIEVLNAFRFKNKDIEAIKKINSDLEGFQFEVQKITKSLLDKSIEISINNNLTIYDSIYVALAQFNGCPLITSDKALYKIPNVIPLEKA